jgi:glycosyltransferase involved in cell wall biosynthesis
MSMRVTLVSPYDPLPPMAADPQGTVGGVERVLGEVAHRLVDRGHEVTVLCSTTAPASETRQEGVKVVRKNRRFSIMRSPVGHLASSIPEDADIVQVAGIYPFTTAPVLARAHRLGIPALLDFHVEPAPASRFARAAARAYRVTTARRYRLADSVLVRSMQYAEASPSLAGIPRERWRVVPNGIDPDRFRVHTKGNGGYVLYVGRLVPYKGVDTLLRAYARLQDPLPLVLAGDGPSRGRLQLLATRLGLDARFLGRVSEDALPRLYGGARLTVLPSVTRQESFGIVLLESLACGTPVLASDLPGVAELARLGGRTAPPRDVGAWADALQESSQPGALPRGPAVADPVRQAYSWDAVAARLESVYEEVLGRRRPAAGVSTVAHPVGQSVL